MSTFIYCQFTEDNFDLTAVTKYPSTQCVINLRFCFSISPKPNPNLVTIVSNTRHLGDLKK
jgi:hypothetical protein